jgi:Flp pilus assembly pilin Flp
MNTIAICKAVMKQLWGDERAQDLIEYSLLAGFVAVAAIAVFPPLVAPSISTIFSKVSDILSQAALGGQTG